MTVTIRHGDCREVLRTLPDGSVHCVVTSPPYWGLRDYGVAGQIGLEKAYAEYVDALVIVFREARRVLRDDGTLWLNLGDSYASGEVGRHDALGAVSGNAGITYKGLGEAQAGQRQQAKLETGLRPKNLVGIPWRVAFALQADGWWLRQDIIWSKPNPMPESIRDRCTKAHEYIFLMSKSERYHYDADAIAVEAKYPGDNRAARTDARKAVDPMCQDNGSRARTGLPTGETINRRSVWEVSSQPFGEAHFATFPPALIEPCILAGCPRGGVVLDPFGGAGTTGLVADRLGRDAILIELNPEYAAMAERRIRSDAGMFASLTFPEQAP